MLSGFDSRPVAWARILIGVATVLLAIENHGLLMAAATDRIAIPLLPFAPPVTEAMAITIAAVGVICGLALIGGLFSRAAAAGASLASLAALLTEQQAYSSHQLLAAVLCGYLAFCDPGARFSIDSWRRGYSRLQVPRLPVILILTQISVVYFFTAMSKINSVYLAGDIISSSFILPLPETLSAILAGCSIAFEFFMAFGLWWRRTTSVAVVLGFGFHFVIAATLHDPFPLWAFGLMMVSTYPLFIARDPRLNERWAASYLAARSFTVKL